MKIMTKRRRIWLGAASMVTLIAIGVALSMVDYSVQRGLAQLHVKPDRVLRIEIFEPDSGGRRTEHITNPKEVGRVLTALRWIYTSRPEEYVCGCGTSGTQILIHMRGEPSIAHITYTWGGYFVLHDGKGNIFSYFNSDSLRALLDSLFWSKEKSEKAEQAGAGQPATRPESKSEGGEKTHPEPEGRSR